jgi:hypothetical protein
MHGTSIFSNPVYISHYFPYRYSKQCWSYINNACPFLYDSVSLQSLPFVITPWYVHFASCFYVDIYCIMGCYYTLWYNTYAFSLLFYKVYTKRENVGSWNSGPETSNSERPILHNSKRPENLIRIILEYIRIIGRRKYQSGPTRWPQAWGRALPPGHALGLVDSLARLRCPSSAIWRVFNWKKS